MIEAVFYARFHPLKGPTILHQSPENSVVPSTFSDRTPDSLLDWHNVSSSVIPPYEFCDKSFSICANGHRVLGHPISLEESKYERNRFTFSVCFVINEDGVDTPYARLVEKTAKFFRRLEDEDEILSRDEKVSGMIFAGEVGYAERGFGAVKATLDSMLEDLNAYGECMIHIDDFHTLNLKIFSVHPTPPHIKGWEVPLLKAQPESSNSDLTLQRILPHINGVNHVQAIAELADTDLQLAKTAIRNLLYLGYVLMHDIFTFGAIYTPTPDIAYFMQDAEMQDECRRYVAVPEQHALSRKASIPQVRLSAFRVKPPAELSSKTMRPSLLSRATILTLYTTLRHGLPLHEWRTTHFDLVQNIDIRRLIFFGVIKGFLHRQHKYALALSSTPPEQMVLHDLKDPIAVEQAHERAWKRAALSSGYATPPTHLPLSMTQKSSAAATAAAEKRLQRKLRRYLDGKHCFDQICSELHLSEKDVMDRIAKGDFGEVVFLNR